MTISGTMPDDLLATSARLTQQVLEPMKQVFVGKDEVIDLLGVALISGENLFLLGPPGTAKSAVVQELGRRLGGKVFDYLLTRFTEPNELFGPFDIRRLREGDLVTNTDGMLPEAEFVFLDELLNANSAILNSLLMVLNERVFRRGREVIPVPLLMVVAASNHLPEDEALRALFDRFLLRVNSDNIPGDRLLELLSAGWKWETERAEVSGGIPVAELRTLQQGLKQVDLTPVLLTYVSLIQRLRTAGIAVSDRRAVKLQRVIAASTLLCGRTTADVSDLWVLRHIWDTREQQLLLQIFVRQTLEAQEAPVEIVVHPQARSKSRPDPEHLAQELDQLRQQADKDSLTDVERAALKDQLASLATQCEWISAPLPRSHLQEQITSLWQQLGA